MAHPAATLARPCRIWRFLTPPSRRSIPASSNLLKFQGRNHEPVHARRSLSACPARRPNEASWSRAARIGQAALFAGLDDEPYRHFPYDPAHRASVDAAVAETTRYMEAMLESGDLVLMKGSNSLWLSRVVASMTAKTQDSS